MPRTIALSLSLILLACGGGDTTSTGSGGSGGSGAGTSSSGGSGATGGAAAAGGNGGMGTGAGGEGGSPFVDPLAGVGSVAAVSNGHQFTEGPVWLPAQGLLYFSDIPDEEVFTLDEANTLATWTTTSGGTNGNALDVDGSLISCVQLDKRVIRHTDPQNPAAIEVVADQYGGLPFNRPNDAIVRSDGSVYFTDPNYSGSQSQPFQGVFHVAPSGSVSLVDDAMDKPNGIALSPDETVLYVTDAGSAELWTFAIASDGSVTPGSKAKLADTSPGPDGFAVDDQGYLYLSTAAGIDVHAPDGTLFGNLPVPQQPANCTFGGSDRRTLYITARQGLYAIHLNVPGLP
ncbi:MAG: SMP-30/gluconolactonase/LRE family protein [Polyangiaceae bacterium]